MASNVNITVVEGRLTHDPMLATTKNGKKVCRFSVANNRYYLRGKEFADEVSFFRVVVWGALAERCAQSLKKGSPVLISGTLKQNAFTTKNGEKRQEVIIVGTNVKFLSGRNKAEQAAITPKVVTDIPAAAAVAL